MQVQEHGGEELKASDEKTRRRSSAIADYEKESWRRRKHRGRRDARSWHRRRSCRKRGPRPRKVAHASCCMCERLREQTSCRTFDRMAREAELTAQPGHLKL